MDPSFASKPIVVPVDAESAPAARALCTGADAGYCGSIRRCWLDHHGAVTIFVARQASDLTPAWDAVREGLTTVPVLFLEGLSQWPGEAFRCTRSHFFDRPRLEPFLDACRPGAGVFLNAHGRADAVFFPDGRICGGPWSGVTGGAAADRPLLRSPACVETGRCYRPDQRIEALGERCPSMLFTNACESLVAGSRTVIASPWTLFRYVLANGIRTFVGTPSFRSNSADEIRMAYELFRSGYPIWQVVHLVNSGMERSGFEGPSLILHGDPFVTVEEPRPPQKLSLNLWTPGAGCVIRLEGGLSRAEPPEEVGSVASRKGDVSWMTAAEQAGEPAALWLAGAGETTVRVAEHPEAPGMLLHRELEALRAWQDLKTVLPPDQRDHGLELEEVRSLGLARSALRQSAVSSQGDRKLVGFLEHSRKCRLRREAGFVARLARQVEAKAAVCAMDLVDERLRKTEIRGGSVCRRCGGSASEILYEEGWRSQRCTRCGIVSLRSGPPLIHELRLPRLARAGADFSVVAEIGAPSWRAAIFRGKVEGFELREQSADRAVFHVPTDAAPHFYYVRVYAMRRGHLDVAHGVQRVVGRAAGTTLETGS